MNMLNQTYRLKLHFLYVGLCSLMFLTLVSIPFSAEEMAMKQSYNIEGVYVEGCSCNAPCGCELIGLEKGCEGVGAFSLKSGKYKGQDLSGVSLAYAGIPASWIRIYIQASSPEQFKAAKEFAKANFKDFGEVKEVKEAKVDIHGSDGKYMVKVDDGKIMTFETKPVLGGDKKTPVSHTNTQNKLVSTFYQGITLSASYTDGESSIQLKESNSYFNPSVKSSGEM